MGDSGHFARIVKLLTTDIRLNDKVEDCGTVHPVALHIKSNKFLSMLVGRWYRTQHERKYRLLTGDEKHLIGETILVRDPSTCACGPSGVCKTCYGILEKVNRGMSIGGYAAAHITKPVSQNVLSTKHLLTTVSKAIEFIDSFFEVFTLSSNQISVDIESEVNLEDYKIIIDVDDMNLLDEYEEDEYNAYIYYFKILNIKTKEVRLFNELNMSALFLSPEFYKYIKCHKKARVESVYEVSLAEACDNLGLDPQLFMIQIENNELTKPLYSIMHLIDRMDRGVKKDEEPIVTIDALLQRFIELLIEANIHSMAVHASVIIMPLVRSVDNVLGRPDFTKYGIDYRLLTVKGALEKHPSVTVSLSFQYLERQLKSVETYLKKSNSYLDPMFKEKLNFKK